MHSACMINPKVSVIIPVYNALPYMRESVDSVRTQSLREIEIILVNDGSRDGSGAECEALARLDSRITVLHKSNSGAGLSRTEGLLMARGEYVAFLDADDLMMPRALEKMYLSAKSLNLDMLHAQREIFYDTPPKPEDAIKAKIEVISDPKRLKYIAMLFIGCPDGASDEPYRMEGGLWAALFRRELIERHRLRIVSEREYGSEDFIFNYDVARHSTRIGRMDLTAIAYRMSEGSISRTIKPDVIERFARFSELLEQRLLADGYSAREAALAPMYYFLEMTRGFMKFKMLGEGKYLDKISWCRRQCKLPYVRRIYKIYPARSLRRPHRVHLLLMRFRLMHTLYQLTIKAEKSRRGS